VSVGRLATPIVCT